MLPTGAGTPIELPPGPVEDVLTAVWTADGRHVVFMGVEAGRGPRFYRQSIDGGDPQPITQPVRAMGVGDALGSNPLSPDGRSIAAHMDDLRVAIFPTDGGDPRPIPDLEPGLPVVSWSPDGTAVYVRKNVDRSSRLLRVDPQSGATELVREIESQDPAGIQTIYATHLLDDGASYFYTMQEMFSDLYLVEGWR